MGVEGDESEQGASDSSRGSATPAKVANASPWYRRPRNVVVLALTLAAVAAGVFVLSDRVGEESNSGSSSAAKGSTGPNQTINDYFAANDVTQTPVRRGEPGTPAITFPLPPGWSDSGQDTPAWAYGEILYDSAANPDDPPFVDVLLSKVDGDADPAKILEYAPGELKNLADFKLGSDPKTSQMSGFDAVQLAGLYTRKGQERVIAQKTVVIPSAGGLFVLQLNADAPKGEAGVLQKATALFDEQTKITS